MNLHACPPLLRGREGGRSIIASFPSSNRWWKRNYSIKSGRVTRTRHHIQGPSHGACLLRLRRLGPFLKRLSRSPLPFSTSSAKCTRRRNWRRMHSPRRRVDCRARILCTSATLLLGFLRLVNLARATGNRAVERQRPPPGLSLPPNAEGTRRISFDAVFSVAF